MRHCPRCKSEDIHRSRTKSMWERWRKEITAKRVYRCRACGWRGWGADDGPRLDEVARQRAGRALAAEPPNLKGTALARHDHGPLDIDLEALDALGPASDRRK